MRDVLNCTITMWIMWILCWFKWMIFFLCSPQLDHLFLAFLGFSVFGEKMVIVFVWLAACHWQICLYFCHFLWNILTLCWFIITKHYTMSTSLRKARQCMTREDRNLFSLRSCPRYLSSSCISRHHSPGYVATDAVETQRRAGKAESLSGALSWS